MQRFRSGSCSGSGRPIEAGCSVRLSARHGSRPGHWGGVVLRQLPSAHLVRAWPRQHAHPTSQAPQSHSSMLRSRRQEAAAGRRADVRTATSFGSTAIAPALSSQDAANQAAARATRLTTLVELRRLYRNYLRGKYLLGLPSPIYTQQPAVDGAESDSESESSLDRAKQRELKEQERRNSALDLLAELQLTSEQLKASLRALPGSFSYVFAPESAEAAEHKVRQAALETAQALKERWQKEVDNMPFSPQQAQTIVDARNSRYSPAARQRFQEQQSQSQQAAASGQPLQLQSSSGGGLGSSAPVTIFSGDVDVGERGGELVPLTAADRLVAAETFVDRRIKPVLRRATAGELGDVLAQTGGYLKGLWSRLNGGRGEAGSAVLALDLPQPVATRRESDLAISQISLELDSLEKRLRDASKARENKLRKAGIQGSVQMAIQIRLLDADVLGLSRLLAVRTLQLEMEHTYRSLEDEALDVAIGSVEALLQREGSTTELALLVAEFTLLDEQLAILAAAVSKAGSSLVGEDILEKLAVDIPDMRSRVGVPEQVVYGGQGFTLTKARLQASESLTKVQDGISFLVRGVRLLGSDCAAAGRLFLKAAQGQSLKRREVSAIRRTLLDVTTFIPFAIILIIPLTPLGHVLIFSFIQRYFPSLFPSQFTTKRQDIMLRYEELQAQLTHAQAALEAAEDEAELARAAAAVKRLTLPAGEPPSSSPEAAAALRSADNLGLGAAAAVAAYTETAEGGADSSASTWKNGQADKAVTNGNGVSRSMASSTSLDMEDSDGEAENLPAALRVRALEEQLVEVLDTVHLGDASMDEDSSQEDELKRAGNLVQERRK